MATSLPILIRLPKPIAARLRAPHHAAMVAVVQLVEHQVVILAVAGSSPVSHPKPKTASDKFRSGFWLFRTAPAEWL